VRPTNTPSKVGPNRFYWNFWCPMCDRPALDSGIVNLRLVLIDDDNGNVLETWNVDHDFGDLSKPMPRAELASLVHDAVQTARKQAEES